VNAGGRTVDEDQRSKSLAKDQKRPKSRSSHDSHSTHEHARSFSRPGGLQEAYPGISHSNACDTRELPWSVDRINRVYPEKIEKVEEDPRSRCDLSGRCASADRRRLHRIRSSRIEDPQAPPGHTMKTRCSGFPNRGSSSPATSVQRHARLHGRNGQRGAGAVVERVEESQRIETFDSSFPDTARSGLLSTPVPPWISLRSTSSRSKKSSRRRKHPEGLVEAMKARFPSADLLLSVDAWQKANVKQLAPPRVRMPGLHSPAFLPWLEPCYRPSPSRTSFRLG